MSHTLLFQFPDSSVEHYWYDSIPKVEEYLKFSEGIFYAVKAIIPPSSKVSEPKYLLEPIPDAINYAKAELIEQEIVVVRRTRR